MCYIKKYLQALFLQKKKKKKKQKKESMDFQGKL